MFGYGEDVMRVTRWPAISTEISQDLNEDKYWTTPEKRWEKEQEEKEMARKAGGVRICTIDGVVTPIKIRDPTTVTDEELVWGKNGPKPEHVMQYYADCFLQSVIHSIACLKDGAKRLKQILRKDSEGWIVTFYHAGQKIEVAVDLALPVPWYLETKEYTPKKWVTEQEVPIFPELIQQGAAKLFGSYANLCGGFAETMPRLLTNYPTTQIVLSTGKDKQIKLSWDELKKKVDLRKSIITFGVDSGIGHEFSINKMEMDHGVKYIQLFDPNNAEAYKPDDVMLFQHAGRALGKSTQRGLIDIKYSDLANFEIKITECCTTSQLDRSVKHDFSSFTREGYFTITSSQTTRIRIGLHGDIGKAGDEEANIKMKGIYIVGRKSTEPYKFLGLSTYGQDFRRECYTQRSCGDTDIIILKKDEKYYVRLHSKKYDGRLKVTVYHDKNSTVSLKYHKPKEGEMRQIEGFGAFVTNESPRDRPAPDVELKNVGCCVAIHNYETKLSAQEIKKLWEDNRYANVFPRYVKRDRAFLSRLTSRFPFGKEEEERECQISRATIDKDGAKITLKTAENEKTFPKDYKIAVRVVVPYDPTKHLEK